MYCHNCKQDIVKGRGYCDSCFDAAIDEAEKEAKIPLWHTLDALPNNYGWYLVDNPEWWATVNTAYYNVEGQWMTTNEAKGFTHWTEIPDRMS